MIVVDVETTGIDPRRHSIVSVGALDFSNPTDEFYQECRVWGGADVTMKALEINGFSEEGIRDLRKKSLEEALKAFAQWLEHVQDRTIAGENPCFDRDFLSVESGWYGIDMKLGYRTVDLHSLCYGHHVGRGIAPPLRNGRSDLGTDSILIYVGLPPEPKPHNALTGAKMEAEALSRLIGHKPLLREFGRYPIPEHAKI